MILLKKSYEMGSSTSKSQMFEFVCTLRNYKFAVLIV